MHDQFACGRRFRVLNVVDDVTRECIAAISDTSISGRRVARELAALIERRGKPGMIVSDNGTELTSDAILKWCAERKVEWHYMDLSQYGSGHMRAILAIKETGYGNDIQRRVQAGCSSHRDDQRPDEASGCV